MVTIDVWRARIGLFNCKLLSIASLQLSTVCRSCCHRTRCRKRKLMEIASQEDTPASSCILTPSCVHTETSTDRPRRDHFFLCADFSLSSYASRGSDMCSSLRRSLLRYVFVLLVIVVISQQLVISGDVELNPGPVACEFMYIL